MKMTELDPYTGTYSTVRKAAKEYPCDLTGGCLIHPGERYVDSVMPPWAMVKDDPECPARPWGEWDRSRYHADLSRCNKDAMVDLYHRTTTEAKAEILRTRRWVSQENNGMVYFSNRIDGQAAGYGEAVIHIRIDQRYVELDDEFPDGEKHYRVTTIRAATHMVELPRWDGGKSWAERNPAAYSESQRRGGGDPLADYLHAKGEL